jgi:hypothetical protein
MAAWVYRYQWDQSGAKWFLIMVGTGMVCVLSCTFFFVEDDGNGIPEDEHDDIFSHG